MNIAGYYRITNYLEYDCIITHNVLKIKTILPCDCGIVFLISPILIGETSQLPKFHLEKCYFI